MDDLQQFCDDQAALIRSLCEGMRACYRELSKPEPSAQMAKRILDEYYPGSERRACFRAAYDENSGNRRH